MYHGSFAVVSRHTSFAVVKSLTKNLCKSEEKICANNFTCE